MSGEDGPRADLMNASCAGAHEVLRTTVRTLQTGSQWAPLFLDLYYLKRSKKAWRPVGNWPRTVNRKSTPERNITKRITLWRGIHFSTNRNNTYCFVLIRLARNTKSGNATVGEDGKKQRRRRRNGRPALDRPQAASSLHPATQLHLPEHILEKCFPCTNRETHKISHKSVLLFGNY